MKFASLALLLLAAVSSSSARLTGETAESSCGTHKSESDCKATSSCVWCKCAAVPSACYSEEDAKSLPPGVFDCEFPNKMLLHTSTSDSHVVTTDGNDNEKESTFEYGLTHSIADGQVAGDLCDDSSPKSYSGYMNVKGSKYDKNGEDKNLFFWMFEKRTPKDGKVDTTDPKDVPFIVWLTGGPGCSSTLALLTENGPCSVNKDGTGTVPNPYSWTEAAHVLWLDQPAGVGFSYGKETDVNEEMVSEDAYYFLQSFYKEHPEYKENPLFVVGESYGGHYAPAIGNKIHQKNKKLADGSDMVKINLKGVAVGNGLTMPEEQYKWYAEMGYNNSHNIKVFNEATYNQMKGMVSKCTALIHQCNKGTTMIDTFACQTAFTVCNMAETSPYQMTGKNPYDIRKKCDKPPLCYDFSNVDKFLNLQSTRTALHVSPDASKKWNACNMMINMKFHTDWMKDMSFHIKDMLNDGLWVLIYAGDVDFICNYLGNRAWTLGLDWKHKDAFSKAEDHEWNEKKGLARSVNGFTYLQVYNAGHMVPSDQPEVALDMIRQFTSGEAF